MKALNTILCLAAFYFPAGAEEITLRWKDAPASSIVGRTVEVRLVGATVLSGKALVVTADGLRINAKKVRGNDGRYEKGESFLPADEIVSMKLNRNRILGRIIGTATFATLGPIAWTAGGGGTPTPGGAAVLVGLPAAGYGLGWLADRRSLTMHFVP